jgi:trans-2,3-dihydro-3-hydroxyanthranilate isomerase
MMQGMRYLIVDVFCEQKFKGNQLAVFLDAGSLDGAAMQSLAREMNFSESTFILDSKTNEKGWPVRIFTPRAEIPFAGHPTLGTSWVIAHELLETQPESLTLDLQAGPILVRFESDASGELMWMTQNQPEFQAGPDAVPIAAALGLDLSDIDTRFPIERVSTGLPFLLVPVVSLQAMQKARVQGEAYDTLCKQDHKAIFLFTAETVDPINKVHARMFADAFGVPEDPATGSANGCLAAWLVRHRYFGVAEIDLTVEQGVEMGRASRLYLRASENEGTFSIQVGGRVIPVAEGRLR